MKFKDLLDFICKETEGMTLESLRRIIIEGLAKKDNRTIILGSNGEFHYLYATPFLPEKEKVFYWANRFEEGEFRKRIQFMYGGKLQTVKFTYSGYDINAVLDRLPTAQILSVDENGVYTVTAEVFGKGIDMWLRSQGEFVNTI